MSVVLSESPAIAAVAAAAAAGVCVWLGCGGWVGWGGWGEGVGGRGTHVFPEDAHFLWGGVAEGGGFEWYD